MIPAWAEKLAKHCREVEETGQPIVSLAQPFVFEDQPERGLTYWDISISPLCAPGSVFLGCMFLVRDMTERRRIEEELSRLEQTRQDYLWIISHDLRNPVTTIQGHALMLITLLERAGLTGREKQSAEFIMTAARHMGMMITDLVDSARVESGRLELDREPVLLQSLLSELLEREAVVPGWDRVKLDIAEDVLVLDADPARLERVLVNLVTNGPKFSPPESQVTVRVRRAGGQALVAVIDQGEGIAPDDLPHVFDRFYKGAGAQKARGLGSASTSPRSSWKPTAGVSGL